jgi:1-acyl-sn-glycerol-3-phosphate acyltransferase
MLSFLPSWLRGVIGLLFYVLNTLLWAPAILFIGVFKFFIPWKTSRQFFTKLITAVANYWLAGLILFNRIAYKTQFQVELPEGLHLKQWYLVIANHQSWTDIFVLQKTFYRKIPMPRFFIKKQLAWLPVLNLAWWALDFPFMKRYSKKVLAKNPQLRGKDMETTQKACEKFSNLPVAIMNFVEGTRFTMQKKFQQHSHYQHLLMPRAGGVAYVISAMHKQLNGILNATIIYPEGSKSFWGFLCGKLTQVKVHIETIPIDSKLVGDYFNDLAFQKRFQAWLNQLWLEKDLLIHKAVSADLLPKIKV